MNGIKQDNVRNAFIAILLLFLIVFIGTLGYTIIEGYSFSDAFFMTVITMSTVGFREVQPLSDPGKIFTVFLIFFSFGIFAYVISTFTRMLVDGVFHHYYKDNKVRKKIKKLTNHIVVCGYGRNGKQSVVELKEHEEDFVIIESNEQVMERIREDESLLYIQGDATEEITLSLAQVERARALITTLPNDADNLFVVLSARQINPDMTIISRASHDNSDIKLKRAGATNVIMPDKIGGQRMAKLVAQPDVIEFIENIVLQRSKDVTLKEISCSDMDKSYTGQSIEQIGIRDISGANIIGLKTEELNYIFNPAPSYVLSNKDKLFALGTPEQLDSLKKALRGNQ
jgi:voltage-gated potassium channel